MNKAFKQIVKKIKEFKKIVIVRHQNSDLDCLGVQFALKDWINLNFKDKEVYCIGSNHHKYMKKFFPKCDEVKLEKEVYLGICVDIRQIDRIDGKEIFMNAKYKICIDHHLSNGTNEFDYAYINSNIIACSEIVADFMLSCKCFKMNPTICKYLYAGIVNDSNNFYYEAVTSETLKVGSRLLEKGKFNPFNDVHSIVSFDSLEDVKLRNKFFDKIVYEDGFAYYLNTIEDLKKLGVTAHFANEKIGDFNSIEEFEIILSIAEYEEKLYRCSIRSKSVSIVEIAQKYGGGGHKLACGIRKLTLQELDNLKKDLKEALKIQKKLISSVDTNIIK